MPVGCAAYMDFRVGPDYLNDAIKNGDLDLIFIEPAAELRPRARAQDAGGPSRGRPSLYEVHALP